MSDEIPSPQSGLFLTKAWGFEPETNPTFGFSLEWARSKFLNESAPGDWIVIAGTKGEPTPPLERGRLLGVLQVARVKVNAESILKQLERPIDPVMLNDDGSYKWPWAMPIVRAYRFDPPPDTAEILGSYLSGQDWAVLARNIEEELGKEAKERVLGLKLLRCEIADLPELEESRAFADSIELTRRDGPSGPPPSSSRTGSERALGAGYAYALALRGGKIGNAIKIGSTHAPEERLAQLNKEIHPRITGCKWEIMLTQTFASEAHAYNFEQLVLKHFEDRLVLDEREIISVSKEELKDAWIALFVGKAWVKQNKKD